MGLKVLKFDPIGNNYLGNIFFSNSMSVLTLQVNFFSPPINFYRANPSKLKNSTNYIMTLILENCNTRLR